MKKVSILLCSFVLALLCAVNVSASSGTMKVTSNSTTVGNTVSVKISINGSETIGAVEFYLDYDSNILEYQSGANGGGGGRLRFLSQADSKSLSYTITFKAKKAGTSKLSLSDYAIFNLDPASGDYMNVTASNGKITVNPEKVASSDNTLSSLRVGGHTLSPAFSKEKQEYSMTVKNSVKSLTISASTTDKEAKLSISGHKNLKVGQNTIRITVTAENGKTRVYTIKVTRKEGPQNTPSPKPTNRPESTVTPQPTQTPEPTPTVSPEETWEPEKKAIEVMIGEKQLYINEVITPDVIPMGFEVATSIYKEQEIAVVKSEDSKRVLVYLSDNQFYVFDEKADEFYLYQAIRSGSNEYVVLPIIEEMIPGGYSKVERQIDSNTMEVLIHSEESPYYVFYGMNEKNEKLLYTYDSQEGTIQRYHENKNEEAQVDQEQVDRLVKKLSYSRVLIAILSGILVITVIIIIVGKIRKRIEFNKL